MLEMETNGIREAIDDFRREKKERMRTGIEYRRTFPLEIFPAWLQRYAHELAASCEVPVCIAGLGILAMMSACYGVHLRIAMKNRYASYCHDWFFVIASVSYGKSPIFSQLRAPLDQMQKVLRELVINGEEDAIKIRTKIDDASPESMVRAQSENDGAIALVSGETTLLSRLADPMRPYPLQPYLSGHTGEPYDVLRIMRGPNEVEKARLAIFAGTQEVGLQEAARRPEIQAKGFLARPTLFVAPDISEDDFHDDDPEVSEALAMKYEETLRELGIFYRSNETQPLQFSPEARAARLKWRNRFKRLHRLPGSPLHFMGGHCSKLEDKVCRWAGLLHALWCEEDVTRSAGIVTIEDWNRALELLGFDLYHHRAALDIMHETTGEALARYLKKSWLIGKAGEIIKVRDLRRSCRPFKHADEAIQNRALKELAEQGVIRLIDVSEGNKPSPAIEVLT